MFTVEFEFDHVKIVTMDETGEHEDLYVYFNQEGTVFLTQSDYDGDTEDCLLVTYQQLLDILASMHQTEGAFQNIQHKRRRIN